MPTKPQSIALQHATWLSLIEISGPFLSTPVLEQHFPHGLDLRENESEVRARASQAYEEWADNQGGNQPDPAMHYQWLRFVLEEVLEIAPQAILEGQEIPAQLACTLPEYHETLRPLLVLRSPYEPEPRLLVQLYPYEQDLNKVVSEKFWKASPATRMTELLRHTGVRLGLVTNGRHWMLVNAPKDETTGYYTWDASLWSEEKLTLQAFRTLLGMERFFNVPDAQRLETLLATSAEKQEEVTNQLGDQVRRAVETLVRTLDRVDKDSQRALLAGISEKVLYEAALTVMMRLVFLLSAEEREMLLLGDPLYEENYAISTIHKHLQEQADQQGEEVLGLRHDAWSRLLATFRVVYGGVEHISMRLPAYGGTLFDPDRFPFLEGRKSGTNWRATLAEPLLIDNRTVLHLLRALQFLQVRIGGINEARRLSFRALDIEQIGHVYEGLLDHTARRATTTILGLVGGKESEAEATLETLEQHAQRGQDALLIFLAELTGRSATTLEKSLALTLDNPQERSRLMAACDNNQALFERVLPFAGLLRKDTFKEFLLVTPGSVYVTHGSDRRSTGTHYTPRSLTEPIVQHALDPLVYHGPAEGLPQDEWQLRSANEILDLKICDFAMGSGAFLVQACRYLSEKLVAAWDKIERGGQDGREETQRAVPTHIVSSDATTILPRIAPDGQLSRARQGEELLPRDNDERLATARRIVVERCLFGVDKNPMAVEMAKLSLWLITLAKDKPFTFLDSNLKCGDSLLGVNLRQLKTFAMDAGQADMTIEKPTLLAEPIRKALDFALPLRREISMRLEKTAQDASEKARKLAEVDEAMQVLKLSADLLIAQALYKKDQESYTAIWDYLFAPCTVLLEAYYSAREEHFTQAGRKDARLAYQALRAKIDVLLVDEAHKLRGAELKQFLRDEASPELQQKIASHPKIRTPFHWPLEFPEVFARGGDEAGFAAIISNPPFRGGKFISGTIGNDYREFVVEYIAFGKRGSKADLCTYFLLRSVQQIKYRGIAAFITTNTIAQGDTREVGLDQIIAIGGITPRAISSRQWPGDANLEIAQVWLRKGDWNGLFVLNDIVVENITSFLTAPGKIQGNPYRLLNNADKSFQGSVILGMGLTVSIEEAQKSIHKNPSNKSILFPYINGDDLNTRPDQSPSRWVINFHDWPLEKAEHFPEFLNLVKEKVKPQRDLSNRKIYQERWWQFAEKCPTLYATIAGMDRVLAIPFTSKYLLCAWLPANFIYSNALVIISSESNKIFALMQCTFHGEWSRINGSSMRTDLRYTPTDCFQTFPFPKDMVVLESIGERYYTHRQSIMQARQEGLTKTYNRFHNPGENAAEIVELRELHREMDEAVARAYGWDDLQLEHGFHETKQGLRYTISETARREVLDRLLLLNHERHAEEVAAGLVDENGKPLKKKTQPTKGASKGRARVVEAAPVTPPEDGMAQGKLF